MKIKIKRKLMKESVFSDSRDWKSIDDFEQWSLSQVEALAKYRKGQGKFDYDFYEKTYEELKKLTFFLNGQCKTLEATDNNSWWREKLKKEKLFLLHSPPQRGVWGSDSRRSEFRVTSLYSMVKKHGVEYFLHRYNHLNAKFINFLKLKVSDVNESSRTKSFGTKLLYEYRVCSEMSRSDRERLKDLLQNMEKLRKTYPFKLKHLPTLTKWTGLEEVSSMGGGAVHGHAGEKKDLEEMYSSAAIMGSGGGGFPKERSPEGHKRYVRIRFKRQGLQNFKPNRYFRSKDQQLGEKKSSKNEN